ncbi:MAG: amidohydrolase [Chloroflexi bacterium]|nr:amidohydrolase [Chloroflexota bacterium]
MRQAVDCLIKNAQVITLNSQREFLENGAIAIAGGRIVAVGPSASLEACCEPNTVIDASGLVALSGLVNVHAHTHSTLTRGTADDAPLLTWLKEHAEPEQRSVTDEECYWAALLAFAEMLKSGTTCVLDMSLWPRAGLEAARRSGIRCTLAPYVADGLDFGVKLEDNVTLVSELSGGDGLHRAWFGLHSILSCSPEQIRRAAELAEQSGVGIHIHANEVEWEGKLAQERFGQRPVEYLHSLGALGLRTVLAHCVWLSESEMELLAKTGTHVAHCPTSNAKLGSGVAPIVELRRRGVNVGLATDGARANNNLDMLEEMKVASLLQRVHNLDPTILPAYEVLEMATLGGAKSLGLEKETGSLEPGKWADLILIDTRRLHLTPIFTGQYSNVVSHLVFAANGGDVHTVMVGGRLLVRDRHLTFMDEEELMTRATRYGFGLLDRARDERQGVVGRRAERLKYGQ